MKREFKKWFDINWYRFESDSDRNHPIYSTYRDKNFKANQCKRMGVKLDDYWWTYTYVAYKSFKAGFELNNK